MILPLLVRTTLTALQSLPVDLRPSAAALGLTQTTTIRKILLPAALPGILVGVTIGVARSLSETAALIFTSGYATRWPDSPGDSGRALSVHVYDLAMNIPNGAAAASASALVLLLMILVINSFASFLAERWLRRYHS
jgi:phosphate transport system permease protein